MQPADFEECQQVHRNLSLCLNFYDKFSKIWDSLNIVDRSLSFASAEQFKKLAWIIYITGKMKILNGSDAITDLAFLLYATVYWVIMLCPKDVKCSLIDGKLSEKEFG